MTADVVIPAASCQLSIPTTNTGVRPKATGFRNESTTTGNFVICPVIAGPGNGTASPLSWLNIFVYSLDGTSRNVSCTGMTGWYGGYMPPVYSTKTFSSDTTGQGYTITWWPTDFGGLSGTTIPGSLNFSVTCNLPPQTAINFMEAIFPYAVGN